MIKNECFREFAIRFRHNWRLFVAIFAPIILSPLAWALHDSHSNPIQDNDPNKKFRTAYVIMVMATFWVLEVLPLAVTSLIPLVLFPLLDIQDAATVSKNYMKESNMIFLGAIILALSIEYCGLHIRVALKIISVFGSNPARIMMGTMLVAAAMSMWISDTSCTTMLLPILSAISAAMFREEQDDVMSRQEDDQIDESKNDYVPHPRVRRESTVFTNSALQGHLNSVRRRSRRSDQKRTSIPTNSNHASLNSKHASVSTTSDSGMDEMTTLDEDHSHHEGRRSVSSRDVSSMSIIMEGVAVPSDVANGGPSPEVSTQTATTEALERDTYDEAAQMNIRKMLLFAVAYSASIGGTGSLVGTGPIKVFKELVKEYKLEKYSNSVGITFATWMAFNIPPLIINILVVWAFLVFRYMGFKRLWQKNNRNSLEKQKVKEYLHEEYKKLGPMSGHEISVAIIFVSVVVLWLFRDPQLFPGWSSISKSGSTGDSTAGMLGVILLFVLPKNWSFLNCRRTYQPMGKYEALLDWKFVSSSAPWGYVLLIGSGYAIADASQKSYLSHYIGVELDSLKHLPNHVLLLTVMFLTSFITEVVSNTACASLILPVLFSVSCTLGIHPIYLTMASAVTASYAFMLPISSPPNAIIFATGELGIKEMLQNGLILNVVCNLLLYLFIITYGDFIFQFSTFDASNHPIYQDCTSFNPLGVKSV